MPNNPYSDESMRMAPTDAISPTMPDIPIKLPTPAATSAPVEETSTEVETPEIAQEEARTVKYSIGKLSDYLQWFIAVLEVALALRFVLKLIGADPNNPFALLLYGSTNIVLFPFSGIIPSPSVHANQAFEWSTLIAMVVYALTLWAIKRFLHILITGPEETAS